LTHEKQNLLWAHRLNTCFHFEDMGAPPQCPFNLTGEIFMGWMEEVEGWRWVERIHKISQECSLEHIGKSTKIKYTIWSYIPDSHKKKLKPFCGRNASTPFFPVCRHGRNTSMSFTIYRDTLTKKLKVYRIDINIQAHIENQYTYMKTYKRKYNI